MSSLVQPAFCGINRIFLRAFFRRSVVNRKLFLSCPNNDSNCAIIGNKQNCKKCRFEKCLQVYPFFFDILFMILLLQVGMRREMVGLYKHNSDQQSNKSAALNSYKAPEKEELDNFIAKEKMDCNTSAPIENVTYAPFLDLTHEEEFRIYELLVRREHLVDGMFGISLQYPLFLDIWKKCILSQNYQNILTQEYRNFFNKKHEILFHNFTSGGSISQSIDMFDEFKNLDGAVKTETLCFSLRVMQLCIR